MPIETDGPGRKLPGPSVIGTFRESLGLLATRRFGTFWFASLLSNIGTWAQQVAEPWLLLTLGASSFLMTGAAVGLLGVRHGLLLDGLAAMAVQSVLARTWLRASPDPIAG